MQFRLIHFSSSPTMHSISCPCLYLLSTRVLFFFLFFFVYILFFLILWKTNFPSLACHHCVSSYPVIISWCILFHDNDLYYVVFKFFHWKKNTKRMNSNFNEHLKLTLYSITFLFLWLQASKIHLFNI